MNQHSTSSHQNRGQVGPLGEGQTRDQAYPDGQVRDHQEREGHDHEMTSLTRQAISATVHCLTGCAIGEVLGMVLSTWWGWSTGPSVALSVGLAFVFGYSLTITPVLRAGVSPRRAIGVTLTADTASITTMEIVDNAFLLAVPGAMAAGLATGLFWGSLVLSLAIAFVITVPVNRALIARGKGHAVMHEYH